MDTREAIEYLDKKNILDKVLKMKIKNVKKLAKLLQRGEADGKELKIVKEELKKVWQMWNELENKDLTVESDSPYVNDQMYYIKQKYFPKEIKNE